MSNTKNCPRCKTVKEHSLFYRHGRGLSGYCKECSKELTKQQVANGYFIRLKRKPYQRKSRADPLKARNPKAEKATGKPKRPARLTDIELVASILLGNVRKRSVLTKRDFDLTREGVFKMVRDFCESNHYSLSSKDPFKPSIDRIDHLMGYTQDNVRIVWMIENCARNTFTDDQVIEFCKRKLGLI